MRQRSVKPDLKPLKVIETTRYLPSILKDISRTEIVVQLLLHIEILSCGAVLSGIFVGCAIVDLVFDQKIFRESKRLKYSRMVQKFSCCCLGYVGDRLEKIDSCEFGQTAITAKGSLDCGPWAKRELQRLINDLFVAGVGTRGDRYDRLIAQCRVAGIGDLGSAMVATGAASIYNNYEPQARLRKLAETAKREGKGIHGFIEYQSPRVDRRTQP